LNLDSTKINGKHLLSYTGDELQLEKKKVKNELKGYDQAFLNRFQRVPSRSEKEPMRHLYMYYKRLKQAISKQATLGGINGQRSSSMGAARGGTASRQPLIGGALGSQPQSNPSSRATSVSSVGSSLDFPQEEVKNPEEHKLEEDKGSSTVALNLTPTDFIAMLKKHGLRTQIEAQKKFLDLKQERRDLRAKLDKFQKDFETNHQRKIRYTKDIGPVAHDFKRYKELKIELAKFEQLISRGFDNKRQSVQ